MVIHNLAILSTIWLAIVGLVIAVINGLILYALIKGMIALDRKLRNLFPTLQMHFRTVNRVTRDVADRAAAPIIAAEAKAAQARAIQRAAIRPLRAKGRM